jgi:hypothetical protein
MPETTIGRFIPLRIEEQNARCVQRLNFGVIPAYHPVEISNYAGTARS